MLTDAVAARRNCTGLGPYGPLPGTATDPLIAMISSLENSRS
jgi:hypothetical protein